MEASFVHRYGPWAVVTGGARGIGKALTEKVASRGLNVIIVDILEEAHQVAREISERFQIQAKVIQADLGDLGHVERVIKECEPFSIGLFCCNHASTHLFPDGKLRLWLDTSEKDLDIMPQVNLVSSTKLIYQFAQRMRPLKKGGIIIVSSGAALIGEPYLAHYSAAKAFLDVLGTTLWWELKQDGIDVTTILPGATNTLAATRFMTEEGKAKIPLMPPEEVAEKALLALGKKIRVIPGVQNNIQSFIIAHLLPRRMGISSLAKFIPRFFSTYQRHCK